jgi:hypothetical protein
MVGLRTIPHVWSFNIQISFANYGGVSLKAEYCHEAVLSVFLSDFLLS